MNRLIKTRIRISRRIMILVSIAFLSVSISGCQTLKRKFTRKSKKKKEEVIPVLNPIDYPPKIVTTKEKYAHHYSLWRVWHQDLINNIRENDSLKRIKHLISQEIVQLEAMKELSIEEKVKFFEGLIEDVYAIQSDFEKPEAFRNPTSIIRKLNRIGKAVRAELPPDKMEEFLKDDI